MSHIIDFTSYPENCNKKKVQRDWDIVVQHEDYQEGASGLPSNIRWLENFVADNKDEAEAYIKDHDKGWYDCLAVRYRDCTDIQPTKRLQALKKRIVELQDKYYELNENIHYKNVKSEFVGCRHCGSKISRQYIKTNRCPVCCHDMRPDTVLNRLKSLQQSIKSAESQLTEEQKKLKNKAKIKWLVKVEYHV